MRYNNAKLRRRNSKKKHQKQLKAAHNLYQKQIAGEKRAQRQRDTEMKKKEHEAKAAERVAAKERKQQERATATAQRFSGTLNKGKQTASPSAAKRPTKRRRDADAAVGEPVALLPPSPPAKTTTCGRTIKLPEKFK
jgi:hypothetical protein